MTGKAEEQGPWTYAGVPRSHRLIERSTLPEVLQALEDIPTKPALTWYRGGVRLRHWSYGCLLRDVARIAEDLRHRYALKRGDRVLVLSSNCPEVYLSYLAILSLGAVAVPVPPDETIAGCRFIIDQVRPLLAIVGHGVEGDVVSDLALPLAAAGVSSVASRPAMKAQAASETVAPDDLAVILFTSGTTGSAKGVCLSHYNLMINAEGLARVHARDVNGTHLCVLPLFHANAFGFSMIGSVYAAGHVILMDSVYAANLWSTVETEGIAFVSAAPQVLRAMTARPPARRPAGLHFVVSAAAPLSRAVASAFEACTGVPIHQGYGLSECTNFATSTPANLPPAVRERLMTQWRVPSIGCAIFGTELKIGRSDGSTADEEEEGEVLIAGHNVMSCYWQAPAETSAATRGGWLHTGDVGFRVSLDGTSFFFLTGRSKDIIIRHGENVSPRGVEEQLVGLDEIGPFAVCGFPNEAVGEEIGVYIQAAFSEQIRETVEDLLQRCPRRHRPRLAIVGSASLPATPTGKVRTRALVRRFDGFAQTVFGNTTRVVAAE